MFGLWLGVRVRFGIRLRVIVRVRFRVSVRVMVRVWVSVRVRIIRSSIYEALITAGISHALLKTGQFVITLGDTKILISRLHYIVNVRT